MDAGASAAFKAKGDSFNPQIDIFDSSFTKDSIIRVFGKPQSLMWEEEWQLLLLLIKIQVIELYKS
jgi:hypothetical protein